MILLDVRTAGEFSSAHITEAVNYDIMEMLQGNFPAIDKGEELIVYCESGNRSMMACTLLSGAGFTNVTNGGGLEDLVAKGYTIS